MKTGWKRKLILCAAITFVTSAVYGGNIRVNLRPNNTWSFTRNSVASPGSDITTFEESADTAYYFNITPRNINYRIDMTRTAWSNSGTMGVWVLRFDGGDGPGTCAGGTAYNDVTTATKTFFTGSNDNVNVHVKFKVDNMSTASLVVTTYATTITFTGVDL